MRIKLMNSALDCLTFTETMQRIEEIIEKRIPTQHVVINANKINLMYQNKKLKKIVNNASIINADGMSILLAAKVLGYNIPERVTGIDLFEALVSLCEEKGYKPYFLGATQEVIYKIEQIYKKKYPNINFAGFHHGYFKNDAAIVADIKKSQADILFLGFSSPKKEYWANQHLDELNIPFVMGVGGSFDVIAGKTVRAPIWMQEYGMEWFYRFLQEPKRMFSRYIIGNLVFLLHLMKEKWKQIMHSIVSRREF